ncbi:MAG: right-handed parallel beta-helix repeat-containing protein [Lachnospiraceae bacterium]|nr:right-handed parallel beta-helix repeat-containing protein [Lachnospiraceae bacterium]
MNSKKKSRLLVTWLTGLCLTMSLLAGCDNKAGADGSSQASQESSADSKADKKDPDGQVGGEVVQPQKMTSEEMYQGFIAGDVRVYCDNRDFTFYDSVAEEAIELYKDSNGYTLKELIGEIQGVNDLIPDLNVQISEVSWTLLDCGNDGEPEMGLWVVTDGDLWGEGYDYQFIIKNIDGKLQICDRLTTQFRSEGMICNRYGLLSDSYYWGMGYSCTYSCVDANGETHFFYNIYSDNPYYIGYEEGSVSDNANKISEREGSEVFDNFNILQYRLKEYEEGEDEKQVYKYSYEYYGGDEPISDGLKALLEELFQKSDMKLSSDAEIDDALHQRCQECGLTDQMAKDDVESVAWKAVERADFWPGTVVTVSTTAQLMEAMKSDTMIFLEPGTYNLTEWLRSDNNVSKVSQFIGGGDYRFENAEGVNLAGYDEESWEITVCNVKNLILRSKDPKNPAKIVCESFMAKVLEFNNCRFVELYDLILGHEIEPGHCSGNVVGFTYGAQGLLDGCDLYGCGAYGVSLVNTDGMEIKNCVIHDCTYGCMELYSPGYVIVRNTVFKDCREYDMFEVSNGDIFFEGCTFKNLNGNFISMSEDSYVSFSDCQFDVKTMDSLKANSYYGTRISVY